MKIEIKSLSLQYFKGAKNLTVNFTHRTDVMGANATGKTRLFDSFLWNLFGKDSEDKKDFSIKSLDAENKPLHRVDHSVTAVLSVDGIDIKLERIYKEKWVKKHGEETPEFSGHETLFFVNGVPHQLKDYVQKVESILPESLFKQLTNPAFFNSMKWNERRAMLFEMAGKITDQDVIASNKDLKKFYEAITGKTFDEYRKELAAKKKLLKDSLINIPARIDEVSRAIVPDPDYAKINVDIDKINARIFQIDGLINSEAEAFNEANRKNQERQNKIYEIQGKISGLELADRTEANKDVNTLKLKKNEHASDIDWFKRNASTLAYNLTVIINKRNQLTEDNNSLRNQWGEKNEGTLKFAENQFVCPACKRAFETDDIEAKKEELTVSFNRNKTEELEKINKRGLNNNEEIERLNVEAVRIQDQINNEKIALEEKQKELAAIVIPENVTITPNPQIAVLQGEIETLKAEIKPLARASSDPELNEKLVLNTSLDELKKQLNIKETNEKHKIRKQELIDQEKSLSQQIADLEKQEFQCEAFIRAKIEMIQDKVNSMFTLVKFKLFNGLINGGSEEICECLINGVPYSDANAAAKVQGGLSIIKTLSKHYGIYAPVFIDNRESTTEIPEMDCQVISLYVDPQYKELKIVNDK